MPPPPRFASSLHARMDALVGSEQFADVRFQLADGSEVPAHRLALCCGASAYLDALLQGGFREGQASGSLTLTLPGPAWARSTLLDVLRFLYTGAVPDALQPSSHDSGALIELLVAADEEGFGAIHYACLQGNKKMVELLLAAGANPVLKTKAGDAPIMLIGPKDKSLRVIIGNAAGKRHAH